MVQALMVVGGSVLTLFLLMAVGFWFGRMGLLSDATLSQVSRILLYIVTPSIMITSFEVERTPASQSQLLTTLAVMAGVYAVYMVLSQFLFPRAGEEHQGIMRFAAVYGNTGFMGLPLIQSVMGDEAMMIAVVGLAHNPGVAFRIFSLLGRANINVDAIIQSIGRDESKDISFTLPRADVEEAVKVLEGQKEVLHFDHVTVEDKIAKVSIVGAGMMTTPGVAAKMFEALYDANINIQMINTSEIRVSVLIDENDAAAAVRAVHDKFFGDEV